MEKPSFIEQLNSSASAIVGKRSRVTLLMAGLAVASPACKGSLNVSANVSESNKVENRAQVISIPEAEAVITLGTIHDDNKQSSIDGLLDFSPYSPIFEPSNWIREFTLSEEYLPWTKLTMRPDGQAVLHSTGNRIAIVFVCQNLTPSKPTCPGFAADPKKISQHGAKAPSTNQPIPSAGPATNAPSTEKAVDYNNYIPNNLRVQRVRGGLLVADYTYLKALARLLSGQKWKEEADEVIRFVESDKADKEYKRPDMVSFIQWLLDQPQNGHRIEEVEERVGIDPEMPGGGVIRIHEISNEGVTETLRPE